MYVEFIFITLFYMLKYVNFKWISILHSVMSCVENTGYNCITFVENIFQKIKKNKPVVLY